MFKSLSTQSAALKAALWLCVIGLPFFATPAQIDIASQKHVLAIVVVEGLDEGLLLDQHGLDLGDHFWRDIVDRMTHIFCR